MRAPDKELNNSEFQSFARTASGFRHKNTLFVDDA